jgi:hypothetical protein
VLQVSASAFPRRFDYTVKEWKAIDQAAPRLLREDERDGLRRLGDRFRRGTDRPNEYIRVWRSLAKLLNSEPIKEWETLIKLVRDVAVRERACKRPAPDPELFAQDLKSLGMLRIKAEFIGGWRTNPYDGLPAPPPELARVFRHPTLRVWYESFVLCTWTDLGGALKISRHPKTHAVRGPLARFFEAVARPVMRAQMPSLESLPDIVRRQKLELAARNWLRTVAPDRY